MIYTNASERGELATALTVAGFFVMIVGAGLGVLFSGEYASSAPQAAEETYPYSSTFEIRTSDNKLMKWEAGMTWANSYEEKIAGKVKGNVIDSQGNASIVWVTQNVPSGVRDTFAQVSISIPDKYYVTSTFCSSIPTSICDSVVISESGLTFSKIKIEKSASINYGVRIAPKSIHSPSATPSPTQATPLPTQPPVTPTQPPVIPTEPPVTPTEPPVTPTTPPDPLSCPIQSVSCAPQNVRIKSVGQNFVEVEWDSPKDCPTRVDGFRYWLDVESRDKLTVCTAEGGEGGVLRCALGQKNGVMHKRILDTSSEEHKRQSWIENMEYTVKVFTYNEQPSCVSPAGTTSMSMPDTPLNSKHSQRLLRKVLVLDWNIPMETQNKSVRFFEFIDGQIQNSSLKRNSLAMPNYVIDAVRKNSPITYSIVERKNVDDPNKLLGIKSLEERRVFEDTWTSCAKRNSPDCETLSRKYRISYVELDKAFNICERVNKNELDEVWHVAHGGLGVGENDMFGQRVFGINGLTQVVKACKRAVPTLAIDVSNLYSSTIHSFSHRIDYTMAFVYQTNPRQSNTTTSYSDFIAYPKSEDFQSPNPKSNPPYGCGVTHVSPSQDYQYPPQYPNSNSAQSYCESFKAFPHSVLDVKRVGPFVSEYSFLTWRMQHLPSDEGVFEGRLNNWWKYVVSPELAMRDSTVSGFVLSDSNADYEINALDLSFAIEKIIQNDEPSFIGDEMFDDINGDGVWNGFDLAQVLSSYGETMVTPELITH